MAIHLLTALGHAGPSDGELLREEGSESRQRKRAGCFHYCILCPILLAPTLSPDTVALQTYHIPIKQVSLL